MKKKCIIFFVAGMFVLFTFGRVDPLHADGVSVQFPNGDVILICDAANDDYSLTMQGDTLTVFSNSATDDHIYDDVRGLFVFLGGGDDTLRIENKVHLRGSFIVYGEDGDDTVRSDANSSWTYGGTLEVDGNLEFVAGPGDGSFLFQFSPTINDLAISVKGSADINCGSGHGHVYLGLAHLHNDLSILTGSGDGQNLVILGGPNLSAQQDEVIVEGDLTIKDGNAPCRYSIKDTRVKQDFTLDSQAGAEQIEVRDLVVEGDSIIKTGWHNDTLIFNRTKLEGTLYLNTGRHNDVLTMTPSCSIAGIATIRMTRGNDYCGLAGVQFGMISTASGGDGFDQLAPPLSNLIHWAFE